MAAACQAGTTVTHGRRKGTIRPLKDSTGDIHPSQVTVLEAEEWSRMHRQLESWKDPPITKAAQIQNHRKQLHQHSQDVVKNWSNTIEGHRQKRLQAHKIKEEKEEQERQQVDRKEAEYQAEQRKKAIERAKTLMYNQTDRVKELHTSYMLSEVLREREAQVEHVARKKELLKMQDKRFLKLQREEQEKAHQKDIMKAKKKTEEMAEVFKAQQLQAMDDREKRRLYRENQLQEQKMIDQSVEMFRQSERERAAKKTEELVEHRKALDRDLEDRARRKEERNKFEEYQDHKRTVFNDAKKGMEKLKRQKEKEWQDELEVQQKTIRDHLQSKMLQASQDEDAHTAELVEKQNDKRDAEEKGKANKQAEMSRAMYKHMVEQMSELAMKKKEQKEQEDELMKMKLAQAIKFKREDMKKQQEKRKEAQDLQSYYVSQVKEVAVRKNLEEDEEREYVKKNKSLLKLEEAQYQDYARSVMAEVKERSGTLQPFHKTIKEGAGGGHGPVLLDGELRPSYQATDDHGAELPSYSHFKLNHKTNTQQRMGFNW